MATLDRSRHFCQIYGIGIEDGAVYEQDGKRFLGNGEEVPKPKAKAPAKQEPVIETEVPQESPSDDAPDTEAVQVEPELSRDEVQAPTVSEETPKNKGGRPKKLPENTNDGHDDLV